MSNNQYGDILKSIFQCLAIITCFNYWRHNTYRWGIHYNLILFLGGDPNGWNHSC